jgi:hypothetical protein
MVQIQAFWYCGRCDNLRGIRGGSVTYRSSAVTIQGACETCGAPVDLTGQRQAHLAIGNDKRRLN